MERNELNEIIEVFNDIIEDLEKTPPLIFPNTNRELEYLQMRLRELKEIRDKLQALIKKIKTIDQTQKEVKG